MTQDSRQTNGAILQAPFIITPEIDVDQQDSDTSLSSQSINEVLNNNFQHKMIVVLQRLDRKLDQHPNSRPIKRQRFENTTDISKNGKVSVCKDNGKL